MLPCSMVTVGAGDHGRGGELDLTALHPGHPTFLSVGARSVKPRSLGVSHVLDNGVPIQLVRGRLAASSDHIDIWKFGWGTAYIDVELGPKLRLLADHGVRGCPGGTLLEIAWLQGRSVEFFDWAQAVGFPCVEVSNGATDMPLSHKRDLIEAARARGFEVLSEVGSKRPETPVARQWVSEIQADFAAGAHWVVTEGRESGTVGMYDASGRIREELLGAIEREVDAARLIFEAPRRAQQAWLVRHFGPDVNLGNIAVDEIVGVETLRRGLRVDTIDMHGHPAGAGVGAAVLTPDGATS